MTGFAMRSALAKSSVLLAICFVATMFLVGCSGAESETPDGAKAPERSDTQDAGTTSGQETPVEAIASIIQLYETRDFSSLIRHRYAEIEKAEGEEQIQSLIDRFTSRFAEDAALHDAIATYTSVLEQAPELTEDGTVATFYLNGSFIKLSKMPDGTWGFHL